MTVGYVVSQIGYDYNDEIYYQNESGGGTPLKVYLDYQKAKAEVDKLNLKELLSCEIAQYAYDLEDIIDDMEEFLLIINKYNPTVDIMAIEESYEFGDWFSSNAKNFSLEDQNKLVDLISLKFYEITTVEIEGTISDKTTTTSETNRFNV